VLLSEEKLQERMKFAKQDMKYMILQILTKLMISHNRRENLIVLKIQYI
jgi:hypothetical protein